MGIIGSSNDSRKRNMGNCFEQIFVMLVIGCKEQNKGKLVLMGHSKFRLPHFLRSLTRKYDIITGKGYGTKMMLAVLTEEPYSPAAA